MGEAKMCFLHIFVLWAHNHTNQANFFFCIYLQCELNYNWSNFDKKLSDFFYNLIHQKDVLFE